jgi:hypothetical protein
MMAPDWSARLGFEVPMSQAPAPGEMDLSPTAALGQMDLLPTAALGQMDTLPSAALGQMDTSPTAALGQMDTSLTAALGAADSAMSARSVGYTITGDSEASSSGTSPEEMSASPMSAAELKQAFDELVATAIASGMFELVDSPDAADQVELTQVRQAQPPAPNDQTVPNCINPRQLSLRPQQAVAEVDTVEHATQAPSSTDIQARKPKPRTPPSHQGIRCVPCNIIVEGGVKNIRLHLNSMTHRRHDPNGGPSKRWVCFTCARRRSYTRPADLTRHYRKAHRSLLVAEKGSLVIPPDLLRKSWAYV